MMKNRRPCWATPFIGTLMTRPPGAALAQAARPPHPLRRWANPRCQAPVQDWSVRCFSPVFSASPCDMFGQALEEQEAPGQRSGLDLHRLSILSL